MLRPVGNMGNMYKSFALLVFMLVSRVPAEPYQCAELKTIVPTCYCEARVFKNVVMNNQVILNCRNLNLSSVPAVTGSSDHVIYEMTLAQNNIQTIPAAAFSGLKIQRLDLRKNRLTNFSNNSFQGLENDLKELYLGAENGANVPPPTASLTNLNSLHTLHMEYFKFPGNGISPGIINVLTGLTSLTLRHNQLAFIEPLSLPASLTSLTLDHQSLIAFPLDELQQLLQLESLTITNTDIPGVFMRTFEKNTKLTYLDLGYNKITTLTNGCFEGITSSLHTLSLRNNPIPSVNSLNEIKQLTALTNLQLSDTTLSSLPTGASFLLNKESLTVLHLDGNSLTTLESNVFSNLGNLEELNLAWNQLASWDDQVFAGLSSLRYLDVGHQSLPAGQSLTLPESLTSLTSLRTLKLSRTTVNPATLWPRISPMDSLEILLLDGTSLTPVPDYAFRNLTQLQELDLDNNGLTKITQQMLAGPRSLRKLALNRNRITEVSHCVFHNFTLSPPLSVELSDNPLTCDCKLRWLLEERDAGRVTLTGAETCGSPPEKLGNYLINLQPADLTCVPAQPEEPCLELYTTPAPPVSSTTPSIDLILTVTNASTTSITVSWTVSNLTTISYFKVLHTNLDSSDSNLSDKIDAADTSFKVTGLESDTSYSVCILAFISSDNAHGQSCVSTRTLSSGSAEKQDDGDDSTEIGIIVGTIVAVLALFAIIGAIVYLVFLRKRKSKDMPEQPHVFSPSELPSMNANSRQFSKPKEKSPPKVGRALDEIKVTVISDGQTAPVSPRHSAGSYQFLDEKHPNPNPQMIPKDSTYNNDVESRPLPTAPSMSRNGYHNMGLDSSNPYNEIENK